MKKPKRSLSVVLLLAIAGVCGHVSRADGAGATLAGVTMPETVTVDGKTLVLNGQGLRSEFLLKVYVAGLYLERRSPDADAILKNKMCERLVLQFLRDVSKDRVVQSFNQSFNDRTRDTTSRSGPDIASLESVLAPVKSGDQMAFTFVPDKGITFSLNGHDKVAIADPAFEPVLLSVWLGPKPPTAAVKRGLLGQ
jgi:hypothetical protein